jgi:hypothetical protein
MVSYLVWLKVVTSSLSLAQLSDWLEMQGSYGSHDKGHLAPGRTKRPYVDTLWGLASLAPKDASLDDHLQSIWGRVPKVLFAERDARPGDCILWLDIAMYYPVDKLLFPTVEIAPAWIERFGQILAGIEVTQYACANGEEDKG